MPEKILKIEEVYGWTPAVDKGDKEGFHITTDMREIYVLLALESHCCERYGHIASEDSLDQFVGADLLDFYVTNTELKHEAIKPFLNYDDDDRYQRFMRLLFVNFETSNGSLQFVLYNAHNGYYGHLADVYYIMNDKRSKVYEGVL